MFLASASYSQALIHTTELEDSPIKIDSYRFVSVNAGKPGHIEIKFTNVSTKKIKQVRFKWQEMNAQGDNIELGDGDITDSYKPKKHASAVFAIVNGEAQKVSVVFPYEVVYTDDTKWKLKTY